MLEESVRINRLTLKNRLYIPPMATQLTGQQLTDYYDEKTANGCPGLVITEHAYIALQGRAHAVQVSAAEDADVTTLRAVTDAIHRNGSAVFAQLNHAGMKAYADDPVTASDTVWNYAGRQFAARAMTADEILKTEQAFAAAAQRAKEAGFDGVEIHSAHGYLLNQFYSPLVNRRTDAYGGQIENRVRFHTETIRAVRDAVGTEYPVILRLGACDYTPGGNTIADAVAAARLLADAGIDALDISGGMTGFTRPEHAEEGYFSDVSAAIREAVHIPVMLTGGVVTRAGSEALLSAGAADMIGIGRPLLKNSNYLSGILPQA